MALAVNDILQITDVQTYLGQTVLNVYFYRVDVKGSALTYTDVADYFQTQVVLPVAALQSTSLEHTATIIRNLTNGLDISEDAISVFGENAADPTPSFTALSFRLIRSTAATRHGSKRIGGIAEDGLTGNSVTGIYATAVADVEAALGSPVFVDSAGDLDLTMVPVIVGRVQIPDPDAGDLDLSVINPVAEAQFIRPTTQTTRRAGRGV